MEVQRGAKPIRAQKQGKGRPGTALLPCVRADFTPGTSRSTSGGEQRDTRSYKRQKATEQKQKIKHEASSCCRRREGNNISSCMHWQCEGKVEKVWNSIPERDFGQKGSGYTERSVLSVPCLTKQESKPEDTIAMVIKH